MKRENAGTQSSNGRPSIVPNAPPMPASMAGQQAQLQADWDKVRRNADAILASQGTVLSLHEVAATLSDTVPQLQVEYEDVVDVLIASNAPADQVAIAQRQSLLAERILGSVNRVLERR